MRLARALMAGAIVSALAAIYQRFGDPSWLSGPPWSTMGRSAGMMGDANPLGVLTATLAPLAFVLLRRSYTALPAAAILWSAAWFSGARSMLIISAAGAAGLLIEWLRARLGLTRSLAVVGAAVLAAVVALALVAPRVNPGTPLGRVLQFLPKTSVADAAYELLWKRDGYGLAAAHAIRDRPVTGVGVGTFNFWAPAYYVEIGGIAIPPDNAQSLWRQVLVERGVLGLLPILWLTILTLRAMAGGWAAGGSMVLPAVLAGFGATLCFGFPLQDPTVAVTLAVLVVMQEIQGRRSREGAAATTSAPASTGSLAFVALLAVSLIAAGIDLAAARGPMSVGARAARFGVPYARGFGDQEKTPDGVVARAFHGTAVYVRPAATNRFELRGWVRAPQGDARVRIWNETTGALIFDVVVPNGGTFAHTVPVPAGGRSVWLRFSASRGEVLVSGTFEGIVVP